MSEIVRELTSQPDTWRRSAAEAIGAAGVLPQSGDRVAVVGCGTSLFMAEAYAGLRETASQGETDAFAASEAPLTRTYRCRDRDLEKRNHHRGHTPAGATVAGISIPRYLRRGRHAGHAGRRRSRDPRIRRRAIRRPDGFATGALALLRASLGQDLETIAADGERALAAELPFEPAAFEHFVFLGRGWTVGLANEAALKIRETSGAWAESYPAMEYRHGPISVAGPRSVIWPLGEVEADLLQDVAGTGATVVDVALGALDPMAELILVQRTAVALALARGLDPDRPRHLTRSVVLS